MSIELEVSIIKALNANVQILTAHLKELKVVINFLSVLTHVEREDSLFEYMEATFGREPDHLSKEVKLKHVKHVWLVVKYAQIDLLMKKNQVSITM